MYIAAATFFPIPHSGIFQNVKLEILNFFRIFVINPAKILIPAKI
jgi:hypothetical protein